MTPSGWIERFCPLVSPNGRVLDLACGKGRHGRLFLKRGNWVLFVDKDVSALSDLHNHPHGELCELDLETGVDWPFQEANYDALVVTNYLYRPHWPDLLNSLKEGGVLLYETFAAGNENFGRPRNPDFLLKPGELLELAQEQLHVVAYEHGRDGDKVVQRLCAVRTQDPTAFFDLGQNS